MSYVIKRFLSIQNSDTREYSFQYNSIHRIMGFIAKFFINIIVFIEKWYSLLNSFLLILLSLSLNEEKQHVQPIRLQHLSVKFSPFEKQKLKSNQVALKNKLTNRTYFFNHYDYDSQIKTLYWPPHLLSNVWFFKELNWEEQVSITSPQDLLLARNKLWNTSIFYRPSIFAIV